MKTKTLKASKRRLDVLAAELDDAEIAEDAKHLLRLYREMVMEEDRGRQRAALLKDAIISAESTIKAKGAKLAALNAHCARKNAEYRQVSKKVQRGYRTISDCSNLKTLRRYIKDASRDAAELAPIKAKYEELRALADSKRAELDNIRKHTAEIEARAARKIYSWSSVIALAGGRSKILAKHIQEVVEDVSERCGRQPRVILMNPRTFKSLSGSSWSGEAEVVEIGGVRIECSNFVMPKKAIVRFE